MEGQCKFLDFESIGCGTRDAEDSGHGGHGYSLEEQDIMLDAARKWRNEHYKKTISVLRTGSTGALAKSGCSGIPDGLSELVSVEPCQRAGDDGCQIAGHSSRLHGPALCRYMGYGPETPRFDC